MSPRTLPASLLVALGLMVCVRATAGLSGTPELSPDHRKEMSRVLAELPLHFEPMLAGATAPKGGRASGFQCRGNGYSVTLSATESRLTLLLRGARDGRPGDVRAQGDGFASNVQPGNRVHAVTLRTSLLDATTDARLQGLEELPGKVHYLIENAPEEWRRDVPTYRKVRARQVYPGIDVLYYGRQGQLEYDFVVAPEASPQRIRMALSGSERVTIDPQGNLLLQTPLGTVMQRRPELYQVVDGTRRSVEGAFTILEETSRTAEAGEATVVGFRVGKYDRHQPLVIDPVLSYSTYLGGTGADTVDDSGSITVDADGYVYLTGLTASTNFPTANAHQPGNRGGPFGGYDAFLTKLTPDGSGLVYSTYFGGSDDEWRMDLELTPSGTPVLFGSTASRDFPTTVGALKRTLTGPYDLFVAEFTSSGSNLVFSTLLGGTQRDWSQGLAVGADGSLYLTGLTDSGDYPTTAGAFQTSMRGFGFDVFLTKMAPDGKSLAYSTFLGGNSYDHGTDVAVTPSGEATVCGFTSSADFPLQNPIQGTFQGGFPANMDGFVTRFNAVGSGLLYSTYLCGAADEACTAMTTDTSGNTYLAGNTASSNFPTTPGAFSRAKSVDRDGFLAKLNPTGTALVYSTFVGGQGWDSLSGLVVDSLGNVWAAGTTASPDFPIASPTQSGSAGANDACVLQLNAAGSALLFSSYLGGSGADTGINVALGPDDSVWVVGSTASLNFPTAAALQPTHGGGTQDIFVARYGSPPPVPQAPSGLTAVALTSSSVELVWTDNANNETGFHLERQGGGQPGFHLVKTLGAGTTGYTDPGLSPSTAYTYRVRAFNSFGASAYSDDLSVITLPPPTFRISGTVREGNSALPDVFISVGTQTAVTDAAGGYEVTGLAAGTYTATPSAPEYTFTPTSRTVTLGPSQTLDFAAIRNTYGISGRVTEKGGGVPGVAVRAGGRSVLTNAAGEYTLAELTAGSYEVVPEKSGVLFDPPQRVVTVGPTRTNIDFTANSGPYLASLTLSSSSVRSKGKVKGKLTLSRAATGNVTIRVTSDNPSAAPAPREAVRIRKGSTTGTFTIQAKKVKSATIAEFSATYGGVTRGVLLTVKP